MPLMQLNALRERIVKQAVSNSMPGLLGTITGGASSTRAEYDRFFEDCRGNNPPTFKTRQEYEAYQARQGTKGDPRMGETPKFKSRDEYFAFMNQHR